MGNGSSIGVSFGSTKLAVITKNTPKTVDSFPIDVVASGPISILGERSDSSDYRETIANYTVGNVNVDVSLNRLEYSSYQISSASLPKYIDFYSADSNLWNTSSLNAITPDTLNLLGESLSKNATIVQPMTSLGIGVGDGGGDEEVFTTPGTYTWTCPVGVTSISAVCIGAGGSGSKTWSGGGGGGGGLGWKNSISVTPGQSYTVVVGDKGEAVSNTQNGGLGGSSYFIDTNTVCGFGAGQGGTGSSTSGSGAHGGGYTGDGGGAGGNGAIGGSWTEGGGGAGGYSGNGASRYNNTVATGGAGGAGQYYSSTYGTGAGGGVGIYGEGTSGETYANGTGYGGRGGSGGGDGMAGETSNSSSSNVWEISAQYTTTARGQINGGQFGGGGGGSGTTRGGGFGGTGAVRLVWGASISFPSNAGRMSGYVDNGTPSTYTINLDSSSNSISYDSNYSYNVFKSVSKYIPIVYQAPGAYSAAQPVLQYIGDAVSIMGMDSDRDAITRTVNKTFIKTAKDISTTAGANSNSKRIDFIIQSQNELVYQNDNGYIFIEEINKYNDPRPITPDSAEIAAPVASGPTQVWIG